MPTRSRSRCAEQSTTCRIWPAVGAVQLRSARKREETAWEWKALAPHLKRMPERATEWLIATVGNAEVCARLGDVDSAPVLYDQLLPCAGLQAIAVAYGTYEGPVALSLRRLAVLLGWEEEGRRHLHAALRSCEDQRALAHLALTHAELATAYGLGSRMGREHAETAPRLARRLGMHPLGTEVAAQLTTSRRSKPSLTRRELEIAALVAERAQQRRDRAATHPVGADGGESRQPHPAQARPHIPCRGGQLVHQPGY
jgi:hypothetical protein